MSKWQVLDDELDAWAARGLRVTLWLRDDDAAIDSTALRRLLAIAGSRRVAVALAAIPDALDRSLVAAVMRCPEVTVIQHGYAHRNYAPAGSRSAELGPERDLAMRIDELVRGREALTRAFGERFVPVLVPPWNRIGDDVIGRLAAAGFAGVSRFGPRERPQTGGVQEVNTHVDLIAWRAGRTFIGAARALDRLVAHLRARRERRCDAEEPTGVLTHHLVMPDDAWAFADELIRRAARHPAVDWLGARGLFAVDAEATSARSA